MSILVGGGTEDMSYYKEVSIPVKKEPARIVFPELFYEDAEEVLVHILNYPSQPDVKAHRNQVHRELLEKVETTKHDEERINIKLASFDVDHTLAPLYSYTSPTGIWALSKLAHIHNINQEWLLTQAKEIEPEYICHDVDAFMRQLSNKTGMAQLHPDNKFNFEVMDDWYKMRKCSAQNALYRDVKPTFEKIKEKGGLIYLTTIAPRASVLHRLFLWGGKDLVDMVDGIYVRPDMPDMPAYNPRACKGEEAFVMGVETANKIVVVPEPKIKPSGQHFYMVFRDANKKLEKEGCAPISLEECAHFGDSWTDIKTAYDMANIAGRRVHSGWRVSVVDDPIIVHEHEQVGHVKDVLGRQPFDEKFNNGKYQKPTVGFEELSQLFNHFKVRNAHLPQSSQLNPKRRQPITHTKGCPLVSCECV